MPKILDMEQTRRERNLNIHPNVNVKKIRRLKVLIQSKSIECFFYNVCISYNVTCLFLPAFLLIIVKTI